MSLTSTYVEDQKGSWYKNPLIIKDNWFICWDDDDPIELVINEQVDHQGILDKLRKLGWKLYIIGKGLSGQRLFPPTNNGTFKQAKSYFLRQIKLGPPACLMKGIKRLGTKPEVEGVFYYSSSNGNGGYY